MRYRLKKQSVIKRIAKFFLKFLNVYHEESFKIVHGVMTKIVGFCDNNGP